MERRTDVTVKFSFSMDCSFFSIWGGGVVVFGPEKVVLGALTPSEVVLDAISLSLSISKNTSLRPGRPVRPTHLTHRT